MKTLAYKDFLILVIRTERQMSDSKVVPVDGGELEQKQQEYEPKDESKEEPKIETVNLNFKTIVNIYIYISCFINSVNK